LPDYNILDYGARGDGASNDAAAIQAAIAACAGAGGGRVVLPAGRIYLSGTIELRANVELHIERGATLLGSPRWADYTTRLEVSALSGGTVDAATPAASMLIAAERADHTAITGGGTIDGNGRAFVLADEGTIYRMPKERPFTFFLRGCRGLTLRDVTIRDGALWTVRLSGCEDVLIHAIHIDNDLKLPNNDGIDLDRCRNVHISDCHIVSGDDCIVLKCCQETDGMGPCENITVTGCTLESTSSALILGAEAREPIRNVIFDACVIRSSHRGLAVHLNEESDIENVLFSNMIVETRYFDPRWWGRGEPIYISVFPWTAGHPVGHVRHIRFQNILARSENGVYIHGWQPGLIDDILLENVRVELAKWSRWPAGLADVRPCPGEGILQQPTAGFFVKNAGRVALRHCEVAWAAGLPGEYRHAIEAHAVDELVMEDFRGSGARPGIPAILRD
jgi:hypothetical protein